MTLRSTSVHGLLGLVLGILLMAQVSAQTGTYFNQRDDQYRLLGLKRAKEAYEEMPMKYE